MCGDESEASANHGSPAWAASDVIAQNDTTASTEAANTEEGQHARAWMEGLLRMRETENQAHTPGSC